ncbi:RNase H family protein [Rhodococcus zopfii]
MLHLEHLITFIASVIRFMCRGLAQLRGSGIPTSGSTASVLTPDTPRKDDRQQGLAVAVVLTRVGPGGRSYAVSMIADDTAAESVVDLAYFEGADNNSALVAVDAFAHVQEVAVERGLRIELYLGNRVVRGWFEQQHNSHLVPSSFVGGMVRRKATTLLEQHISAQSRRSKPARVTIATDASGRNRHRGLGIAYVTSTGNWRQAYLPAASDISIGELEAISLALSTEDARRIEILTDSRNAVEWINGRKTVPNSRIGQCIDKIRRQSSGREMTVRWVKAHAGHPLNETADRLAMAARRNAVAGVAPEVCEQIAQNILADLASHADAA